jgi:hypothetical protein
LGGRGILRARSPLGLSRAFDRKSRVSAHGKSHCADSAVPSDADTPCRSTSSSCSVRSGPYTKVGRIDDLRRGFSCRHRRLLRGAGDEASFPSAGTRGRAGGGDDAQFEITRYECGDAAGGADHAAVEGRQANEGIEFVAYRFTLERYRSFKTSPDQVILARKNRRHLPPFVRALNER